MKKTHPTMFLAHPNYDHDKKKISDLAPFSRPLFPHGHLTAQMMSPGSKIQS